eukprot:6083465-Amphidinium_carterae.1
MPLNVSVRVLVALSVGNGLRTSLVGRGGPTSGSSAVLLNVVVAGLGHSLCILGPFSWIGLGRLRSGRDAPPAEPGW